MCRIAYIPNVREQDLPTIAKWWRCLEQQLGGQGNGVAIPNPDGTMGITKARQMSISDCVELLKPDEQVLFHTRIATQGLRNDDNCHPFAIGTDKAFCHNGSWHCRAQKLIGSLDIDAQTIFQASDSRILAWLIEKYGEEVLTFADNAGAFVISQVGADAIAYAYGGSFVCIEVEKNVWWYGSSPIGLQYENALSVSHGGEVLLTDHGPEIISGSVYKYTASRGAYGWDDGEAEYPFRHNGWGQVSTPTKTRKHVCNKCGKELRGGWASTPKDGEICLSCYNNSNTSQKKEEEAKPELCEWCEEPHNGKYTEQWGSIVCTNCAKAAGLGIAESIWELCDLCEMPTQNTYTVLNTEDREIYNVCIACLQTYNNLLVVQEGTTI